MSTARPGRSDSMATLYIDLLDPMCPSEEAEARLARLEARLREMGGPSESTRLWGSDRARRALRYGLFSAKRSAPDCLRRRLGRTP